MQTLQTYNTLPEDIKEKLCTSHLPLGHVGVGDYEEYVKSDLQCLVVGVNPSSLDCAHISEKYAEDFLAASAEITISKGLAFTKLYQHCDESGRTYHDGVVHKYYKKNGSILGCF